MPWYLFAAGNFCFVVGDVIRAFYESVLGVEAPFPSLADPAYLLAYPLLAAGLLLLVRSRDKAKDRGNVIDAMIIVTSVGLLSWVYLMQPYTQDPTIRMIEIVISIAYPLGTLLLLAFIARLMVSSGARPPAYYLLGISLIGADAVGLRVHVHAAGRDLLHRQLGGRRLADLLRALGRRGAASLDDGAVQARVRRRPCGCPAAAWPCWRWLR